MANPIDEMAYAPWQHSKVQTSDRPYNPDGFGDLSRFGLPEDDPRRFALRDFKREYLTFQRPVLGSRFGRQNEFGFQIYRNGEINAAANGKIDILLSGTGGTWFDARAQRDGDGGKPKGEFITTRVDQLLAVPEDSITIGVQMNRTDHPGAESFDAQFQALADRLKNAGITSVRSIGGESLGANDALRLAAILEENGISVESIQLAVPYTTAGEVAATRDNQPEWLVNPLLGRDDNLDNLALAQRLLAAGFDGAIVVSTASEKDRDVPNTLQERFYEALAEMVSATNSERPENPVALERIHNTEADHYGWDVSTAYSLLTIMRAARQAEKVKSNTIQEDNSPDTEVSGPPTLRIKPVKTQER